MPFPQIDLLMVITLWLVFLGSFSGYMLVYGLITGRVYYFRQWIDRVESKKHFIQIQLGYVLLFLFCTYEIIGVWLG